MLNFFRPPSAAVNAEIKCWTFRRIWILNAEITVFCTVNAEISYFFELFCLKCWNYLLKSILGAFGALNAEIKCWIFRRLRRLKCWIQHLKCLKKTLLADYRLTAEDLRQANKRQWVMEVIMIVSDDKSKPFWREVGTNIWNDFKIKLFSKP